MKKLDHPLNDHDITFIDRRFALYVETTTGFLHIEFSTLVNQRERIRAIYGAPSFATTTSVRRKRFEILYGSMNSHRLELVGPNTKFQVPDVQCVGGAR